MAVRINQSEPLTARVSQIDTHLKGAKCNNRDPELPSHPSESLQNQTDEFSNRTGTLGEPPSEAGGIPKSVIDGLLRGRHLRQPDA